MHPSCLLSGKIVARSSSVTSCAPSCMGISSPARLDGRSQPHPNSDSPSVYSNQTRPKWRVWTSSRQIYQFHINNQISTRAWGESESWEPLPWLSVLWLLGIAGTLFNYVRRYRNLMRQIPLGRKPKQMWEDEWQWAAQQLRVRRRHAIQFRITDRIGPLCCYVPFFYLVLVPQRLWNDLNSEQRVSILRHELSHFTRCDLWKSLLIRVLSLPQWFNPAAWMAIRAFDEAAEWACDDLVMRTCAMTAVLYMLRLFWP